MDLPVSNYVLLVDARAEKGFDFFLKVAALLPGTSFLAIASRSPLADAIEAANELPNVAIIHHVEDMDAVYREAFAVAVPSYHIGEGFGRECIEAQRHGKPVLGSDRGNIPYLLEHSGLILPEDPALWAAEIEKLSADPAHYREHVRKARRNSARYSQKAQREALRRVTASA